MDRRKLRLLKYFLSKCNDGYKVIEVANLFKCIKRYKSNTKLLGEDIEFLKKYNLFKYLENYDDKYIEKLTLNSPYPSCGYGFFNPKIIHEDGTYYASWGRFSSCD